MRYRATDVLRCLMLAAALAAAPVGAAAEPRWGGELAGGLWSGNRELDDRGGLAVARLGLTLDWAPEPGLRLRADTWAVSDSRRSGPTRKLGAGLREALLTVKGRCDLGLGKRVVAWGRTDVVSPTDQLTPTDYRRLTPKDTEQRLGVWGLHLACPLGPGQLQLHVIDPRSFHRVPYAQHLGVSVLDERPRTRAATALRYEVLQSKLDWSLSAMEGIDPHPTLVLRGADTSGLRIGQSATRMRLLGADAALGEGARVWRAEVAWVDYGEPSSALQALRRPWTSAVLQLEWAAADEVGTVSLQVFAKRLRGAGASSSLVPALDRAQALLANELDRNQRGASLRWAKRLWGERAELELLLIHTRPRDDGLVRLRWNHTLSDSLRLTLGGERTYGPADSYLGNLRRNSLAFVEASHTW
jgi:hypothetical protein